MEEKMVSILMPVYNQEKFVGGTIESVLGQTYSNWELLALDDCSTDESWEIIEEWAKKDPRIRPFRNSENKGLIANWKYLIDSAKGSFLSFLEGDDILYSQNLESKMEIFRKYPEVGMVYSNFRVIGENSEVLISDFYKKLGIKTYRNEKITPEGYLYSKHTPFSTYSQIMIKKEVLSTSGYPRSLDLNEKIFLPSDWDFNFRVSTKNKICFIGKILLGYRKHSGNSSAATLKVSAHLRMILDEYEKVFSGNENMRKAIKHMRGKTYYFNIIYYLENNRKKMAWKTFLFYAKNYPANLFRDFPLNLFLAARLFLPNQLNQYFKKIYFSD